MIKFKAKKRSSKKSKEIRMQERIPAVLYGPGIDNRELEIDLKEFEKVYDEAGESSLISLNLEGEKEDFLVLIHDIQYGPLSGKPMHVDFYQPLLKEKTEVTIPIVLEGRSPAVRDLGGTLVKNISEIEIKALPRNLPSEIKVNVKSLETMDDVVRVKDLSVPSGVDVMRDPEDIVISVSTPEELEEEEEEEAPLMKEEVLGEEEKMPPEEEPQPPEEE